MAYFSSGTEGMDYADRYCRRCVHGQDPDRGEYACAVWVAHHEHNYAECNKKDSILHVLIPRSADGLTNEQCQTGLDPQGVPEIQGWPLKWVIVGGESGKGARPFDLAWARSIVQQCQAAGVAVFVKQLGAVPMMTDAEWQALPMVPLLSATNARRVPADAVSLKFYNKKGGDIAEWPSDLRIRQFPTEAVVDG